MDPVETYTTYHSTGDELTPGAKYDFKFKDYAPWAFRQLREQFGIDPADYLVSKSLLAPFTRSLKIE